MSSTCQFMIHLFCSIQAFARIENHYFLNKGFFPSDSFLLDNIDNIRHINATIVQVFVILITHLIRTCLLSLSIVAHLPKQM